MKSQLWQRLQAMDPRTRVLIAAALLAFVLLEAWLLLLRGPLAEWRQLSAQRELGQAGQAAVALQTELDQTRREIARAEDALREAALPRADDDMVLYLIGTLDALARPRALTLGPVRATERRAEGGFKVLGFEAEVRGPYLALVDWLGAAEVAIAPLRTTELRLDASDEGRQVTLLMKFVAYLPIPAGEVLP